MDWLKKNWLWMAINLLAILPLLSLLIQMNLQFNSSGLMVTADLPDGFRHGAGQSLGDRSPFGLMIHSTGEWAIRWLTVSLSITPLMILLGVRKLRRYRKLFGLYAFVYSLFHLIFFIADRNVISIFTESNFILGTVAFSVMLILAITSNRWSHKKLRKAWKKIHKWVYAAALLAVLHVALLDHGSWIPYAIILLLGFFMRLPSVKRFSGFSLGKAMPQRSVAPE